MADLTTAQLQRLTAARWQGEQALFTTAVAMLTERPASEPQCAVVKPLVWVRSDYSSRSECGRYHGLHCESGFWASMGAREITSTSETREEFEAAAQADHEASILSAITLRTEAEVSAEAWVAAIEAAADFLDGDDASLMSRHMMAQAIRAMITDDARAALDRIKAEAEAEGMREAAKLCAVVEQSTIPGNAQEAVIFHLGFTEGRKNCELTILAAIPEVRK